ncbi:MAG: acetyl-CoA carboxylase biotin carboxyl carrier protein [Candidatus Aminicenantes bacterium]|jgi:acetyl-CoA carboxylase biotin carboxyl carrier protein
MKGKIDYKEIIKIIDLLEERDLSEFELEIEDLKIKISRTPQKTNSQAMIPVVAPAGVADNSETPAQIESANDEKGLHFITSPMVGTFYRSPDPSSPPFVEKGESVAKNQTLCIIEAMKLMNEIEAEVEGTLEEIYIKNGKPVEYGQKLFAIKPQS